LIGKNIDRFSPSQKLVPPEFIDKFRQACQHDFMIKFIKNLPSIIWMKLKFATNLAAQNIAIPQQLAVYQQQKQAAENRQESLDAQD